MRELDDGRPAPAVTVTGGPATSDPPPGRPVGGLVVGALAAAVLVAAVVSRPPAPEPPPPFGVGLELAAERITGTQTGIVILPVDVWLTGSPARLTGSVVWAEPVRATSAVGGRTRFTAERPGRVVVLVQPDCALLAPSQGLRLVATVELTFEGPDRRRTSAVLDLGADPAVEARVTALCRPGGLPV